jgi:hypothetical protein
MSIRAAISARVRECVKIIDCSRHRYITIVRNSDSGTPVQEL